MPPPEIASDGSAQQCTVTFAVARNRLRQRCIMVFTGSTVFLEHALGDMLVARAEELSKLVGGEITIQKCRMTMMTIP
ncbi:uncharacterized protein LOC114914949 isoform X2 [Cajanus cajan]|uniref:uncharacterized protein LOC114914949 isoform X2 n=1 Tax=Cajanus cajan TaxID=3821 RepID=UPI0010FB4019|nr:uncharacterized protein LOC114914949 isoform X2 [Cajanus cajan]